jgi:ribosome biogenesis GTP-binding protein YsxC/EngB|eukprot:jgi/Chrpa1/4207/Chrysochromulina_OHIO_Genome00017468-RA
MIKLLMRASVTSLLLGSARALLRSAPTGAGQSVRINLRHHSAIRLSMIGDGGAAAAAVEESGRLSKRAARRRRHSEATPQESGSPKARPPSVAITELAAAPAEWLRDMEVAAALASHFAKLEQPDKALGLYEQARSGTSMVTTREVLPLVIRSLLRMRRVDLALELHQRHTRERPNLPEPSSACVLFLALCRTGQLEQADAMLTELMLAHPRPAQDAAADGEARPTVSWRLGVVPGEGDQEQEPMWHAVGSVMVPALVDSRLDAGDLDGACTLAEAMVSAAPLCVPPLHTLTKLTRAFGKARCMPGVYACLEAQLAGGLEADAESLQVLVDALVRSARFVKGGVSMDTLPREPIPEVAFIGRSNVGKSSLVNMVLGRRAIAYTSKTPGKTQQYNYFILNEPAAGQRAAVGTFHVVDMPGLGYAKVPGAERRKWLTFLGQYAAARPQLRLLVHLVDGQVGPMEVDLAIMRMVKEAHARAGSAAGASVASNADESGIAAEVIEAVRAVEASGATGGGAGCPWRYAIVLTKADKGGLMAVKRSRIAVERALEEIGWLEPADIVMTSSKAKTGRHEMWRLLRPVILS